MALLKTLRIAVACVFGGALAFVNWFGGILISQRPITPTKVSFIPFDAHGGVTYISASDHRLYDGSWSLIWIAFIIHALLYLLERAIPKVRYRKSTLEG